MSATKIKTFAGSYDHYATDPSPTTDAQMQEYLGNQNVVLKDMVNTTGLTWQASQAYALNFVLILPKGLAAKCTVAGTSGTTEPTWATGTITDGSITWTVINLLAETRMPYLVYSDGQIGYDLD